MIRLRRRDTGFTLVELIIIVLIVGIIFAILVPYYLDSLQKAKQRRTMANMGEVGRAMMNWMTDQVSAAAAGAGAGSFDISHYPAPSDVESVRDLLVPVYLPHVPTNDAWGNPFEYRIESTVFDSFGVLAIRSRGRDAVFSGDIYPAEPFVSTLYHEDLVWADGHFIRWPQNWPSQ